MAGVLDGIKVLDFTRVFAGPAATQMLGDLGADIVKVEDPGIGDMARAFGVSKAVRDRLGGSSPSFLALNRNKRSITLDLNQPSGQAVARRLAFGSDVVVHNFRPGVMKRWALDYPSLAAGNERLVYCEFSGYGQSGTMASYAANDVALQAHTGLISITGPAGGPPVRCGSTVIDLHGGLSAGAAILAALLHRERTGKGQRVEASLLSAGAHLMSYFYSEYWLEGIIPEPNGTASHLTVPNQAFPTADGSVVVVAGDDVMWDRCAKALDPASLDRPEFKTSEQRRQRRQEVIDAVTAVTRRMRSREVVERLSAVRVTAAKVNDVGEAADDPQLAAMGGLVEYTYAGQQMKGVAAPFAMDHTPATTSRPPPLQGEHTLEVLAEQGFSDEECTEYKRSGACGPVSHEA